MVVGMALVGRCYYRMVWCVKRRKAVLAGRLVGELEEAVREALSELGGRLRRLKVHEDRVEMEVELGLWASPARFLVRFKRLVSGRMMEREPALRTRLGSLWNSSAWIGTRGWRGSPRRFEDWLRSQRYL